MCMSARSRAPALSLHTLKSLCPISTNTIHSLIKACAHLDHLKQVHARLLNHGLHHHLPSLLSTTTVVPKTVLSPTIAVVVIALAVVWLSPSGFAWALSRSPRSIPGLTGVIVALAGSAAHQALAGLARALGATQLMAFSVGFTRFIVSSHPDTAKEILNSSAFANRPIKESAYELLFHRAMGFASFGEY